MGVPRHIVKGWEQAGLITNHGGGGKGSVALYAWPEVRTAPARRINTRARGTCTICGAPHWARGLCQVHYSADRRAAGLTAPSKPRTPEENAEQTLRRGGQIKPPRTLPYRALAQSCPECGDLRTTPDRLLRRNAGPLPPCRRCAVMRSTRYRNRRAGVDEEFRRRQREHADEVRARVQAATVDGARNGRKQWTGPELEIAARQDLTARQVAGMLGRTLYAVKHVRRQLRTDPRKVWLAAVPGPVFTHPREVTGAHPRVPPVTPPAG
jgi:hypothetical protein